MVVYHLLAEGLDVVASSLVRGQLSQLHFGDASFCGFAEEHLVLHDLAEVSGVGTRILQGGGGWRLLLRPVGLSLGRGGHRGVKLGEEQTRRQDRCAQKNRTYVIELHRVAPVAGKYTTRVCLWSYTCLVCGDTVWLPLDYGLTLYSVSWSFNSCPKVPSPLPPHAINRTQLPYTPQR